MHAAEAHQEGATVRRIAAMMLALWLAGTGAASAQSLMPIDRPPDLADAPGGIAPPAPRETAEPPRPNAGSLAPLDASPSPAVRQDWAPATARGGARTAETGAGVCGLRDTEGAGLPPISDEGDCGIDRPVRISRIAGVSLEPPAVVACLAATALESWLTDVAKPAFRRAGHPLEEMHVAGSYVCRNVNSASEGDLSEHAFGKAIDIARFGSPRDDFSVRKDWSEGRAGTLLRQIYEGACGIFGTTLGPDADRHHHDHFHFDVAERNTPYCR
jgi:hypothetical protein